jgi:Tfp pilus assembly protein PilV
MAILKRLRGATLMETMVATVLLVVIFMVASLVMNSLVLAGAKANLEPINEKLNTLEYAYQNTNISVPYEEQWKDWLINMTKVNQNNSPIVRITAVHAKNDKVVEYFIPVGYAKE